MLVLSRKPDQQIMIGNDIVVTVLEIRGDRVRLGITAPANTLVHRQEVWLRIQAGQCAIAPPTVEGHSGLYAECV